MHLFHEKRYCVRSSCQLASGHCFLGYIPPNCYHLVVKPAALLAKLSVVEPS